MMQKDVTFVIPIFNLKEDRINNLKFILPRILNTGCKTILVEQVCEQSSKLANVISNITTGVQKCLFEHVLYIHPSQLIHKTGMINSIVLNKINTKYVWVNDVDFYMKFDKALALQWDKKFIQPYSVAKKLNQIDSNLLLNNHSINVDFSDNQVSYISLYSALSFIFEKDEFINVGGMNDSLFGWGMEDVDFNNKLQKLNIPIQVLENKGIHLWHPATEFCDDHNTFNDMAILTCHFNWCKYKNPEKNLKFFLKHMKEQKIPVYGVELSLTDEFVTKGIKNWKQIKVKNKNICFQKEACINLIEKTLPQKYKKIAWVDADIEFKNPSWYYDTIYALKKYKVVQMYSECIYYDQNQQVSKIIPSLMKNGKPISSEVFGKSAPGMAWAARRELWKNGGLYPYNFIGGGDVVFSMTVLNLGITRWLEKVMGISNINSNCVKFNTWKEKIVNYVARNVGCINGQIVHNWHGDIENRAYNTRHEMYDKVNIDLEVIVNDDGILEFTSISKEIESDILNYFKKRFEDGINKKSNTNNKIVVYTCITDDYDNLKEVMDPKDNIDYICFTNKKIISNVWEIREIPEMLNKLSSTKIARCIKVLPHLFLKNYEISVWIDASIEIVGDTNIFLKDNLKNYFSVSRHPYRNCVYTEAIAVIDRKKDLAENVIPQILKYNKNGYPEIYGMVQTGILIRKHNEKKCIEICDAWWKEILNGSKRDQLSFNYAIWKQKVVVDLFDPSEFSGNYFKLWTHGSQGSKILIPPTKNNFIQNYLNGKSV